MTTSVSLLDIGDLEDTVPVRGKIVKVKGISAKDIMLLIADFPEMRRLMSGMDLAITPDLLMVRAPSALSSIIVLACGHDVDDEKAIAQVNKLSLGEQADFIRKIWELTFPRGTQSFIDLIQEGLKLGGGSGWGQGTASPEQSKS